MEKDWFSVGRAEQGASESSGAKPESDKKKKRRGGEADSARARRIAAALEAETRAPKKAEHQRARKALADILVEQGPAEAKQSERAKRKESGEPAGNVETEKKPNLAETEYPTSEQGETGRSELAEAAERDKAERAARDEREHGVPQPERSHLRQGELYGGEFVINLQDDKSPAEREIPLHDVPAAVIPKAKTERVAEPEPEQVLSVSHEPEAPGIVPQQEADHEPIAEQVPEHEPAFEPFAPPVFQRQAEQPVSAARAFEVPPPEAFVPTASAHGPENPAVGMPEADPAPDVPEGFEAVAAANAARRDDPAEVHPMYSYPPAARSVSSGSNERMVTKQEADDAVYYATRAAQGRGVAAGFLFAALWARHRGKKLRRNFNELLGKQDKELKKTKEDQHFYAAEQASKQAETDRRLSAAEQRYTYAERQLASRSQPEAQYAAGPLPERNPGINGQREVVPVSPETMAQMQKNQRGGQPEQAPQEIPEQLNVPPEHRLESSAWHTIEVDARTGRPVEQPTFAYGREYYQERKHESEPADQRSAVAGEVALVGASVTGSQNGSGGVGGGSAGSGGSPMLPPNVPSASMQGPPPGSPTAKVRDARDNLTKATSNGPIWPLVVALLIIFVVLIVLLH